MRRQIFLNYVMVATLATLVGPLLYLPGVAASVAAIFLVTIRANRVTQWALLGGAILSVMVPLALEWAGVIPRSYSLQGGTLVIFPRMLELTPGRIEVFLLLAAVLQIVITVFAIGRGSNSLVKAERHNFAQAYRLRQLLPEGAPALEGPPSSQGCEPLVSLSGLTTRRAGSAR